MSVGGKKLSWIEFVKKIQKEENISFKEALSAASKRKKEWQHGGAHTGAAPVVKPVVASMPAPSSSPAPAPSSAPAPSVALKGGKRKKRTVKRKKSRGGKRKSRATRRN